MEMGETRKRVKITEREIMDFIASKLGNEYLSWNLHQCERMDIMVDDGEAYFEVRIFDKKDLRMG